MAARTTVSQDTEGQWPISGQFKKEERRTKFFTMFSSIQLSDMSKNDKVMKTISIYLTVEKLSTQNQLKKPFSVQQKEERTNWA